ncbi:MAG: endonuclease/exonuclease/phosphatase family protein [Bacteroidetes bacterium]|nr:MAG: endonuclease/exonuclease/phosphatase family protein [Bacteroidota bacterium]
MNKQYKYYWISLIAVLIFFSPILQAQNFQKVSIGFYNLENLFDTIDTPEVRDSEFTPSAAKKWNSQKYYEKLDNMAKVISKIAIDKTPEGVAILGICEVENKEVIEDLVHRPALKNRNYKIAHINSPDKRGIDVALIYQASMFELESALAFPLKIEGRLDFYSRDQLLVSGKLLGEKIHILVNHWPSRSGGEERSMPLRNAAGDLSRSIVNFILSLDSDAKIIIMGDLNDDPHNASVVEHLKATSDKNLLSKDYLYDPFALIHKPDSFGSLAYRGKWNLFDQIIITPSLIKTKRKKWHFKEAFVFNADFLKNQEGKYKGFPFRTFAGNRYLGGYSDHLPTYIILER